MYIGHYGIALLAKKKFRDIPLWLLFIAVQFPDLLAFFLIIVGIERIHYAANSNPFYRTVLEYLPYSHSLFSNLIFAGLALLIFWRLKNKKWGFVLSACLLSHWFIDLIFQKSNLPLILNNYKVGFGLWDFPLFSFFLEIIFVAIAGYLVYKDKNLKINRPLLLILILIMLAFFSFIIFVPEPPLVQSSSVLKAFLILLPYLAFTYIAYIIEFY